MLLKPAVTDLFIAPWTPAAGPERLARTGNFFAIDDDINPPELWHIFTSEKIPISETLLDNLSR